MITDHHDGHGLNERLAILPDEPDTSGASHSYTVVHSHATEEARIAAASPVVATIQFQKGPRDEEGSTPGVTEAALIAILIDRVRGFQAGPYACRENALTLTKLEEALHWSRHRADERARRGVLGKNAK